MTEQEASAQFDRLAMQGYFQPSDPEGRPGAVFVEWYEALRRYDVHDVEAVITDLIRGKSDRAWPTIGTLRGLLAAQTNGREQDTCARCHGSRWVEARPYRANGNYLYEGVVRCPECGVPPPKLEGGHRQTPISDAEYRAWWEARRPVEPIESRAEALAQVQRFADAAAKRTRMPSAQTSWHEPEEVA